MRRVRPKSSLRVVLKENPNPPMKLVEAPPAKHDESANIVLKEAPDGVVKERDLSPDGINSFASSMLEEAPADTKRAAISDSSYAQECAAIKDELRASKLKCKLCGAACKARMTDFHAYACFFFGAPKEDREGFKRLTTDLAQRLAFNWKFTIRGFVSKARQETKRSLKHGKSARRGGGWGAVDRFYKGWIYSDRMIKLRSTCRR